MLFEELGISKFFIRAINKEGIIASKPIVYIKKSGTRAISLTNGETVPIKKTEFVYALRFSS